MLMKQELASDCGGCGSEERWILHNVRYRGIYRRLCTSCVLKFHAGSFCPVCFDVHEGSSLPNERIMCLKCPSSVHIACVKDGASSYICPSCSNPSFVFFDSRNKKIRRSGGELVPVGDQGKIDVKSAKVLVAAARIASVSMNKAATAARIEAERRVKEAALARKRTREALERLLSLAAKENEKGKGMIRVLSPIEVAEQKKKSKGNGGGGGAVAAQLRIQNQFKVGGNNKFGGVPASLNNGGAMRKDKFIGFHASDTVQRSPKRGVSVNEREKLKGSPSPVMGYQQLQNPDTINANEKSSNLTQIQLQHPRLNIHRMEADRRKSDGFADSGTTSHRPHSNQGGKLSDGLVSKTNSGVVLTGSWNMAS